MLNSNDIPAKCEVVIIGAGVAGASAAYYLNRAGCANVIVLDSGNSGWGGTDPVIAPYHAVMRRGDDQGGVFTHANRSGTAVFSHHEAGQIKMMMQGFPVAAEEFIQHHGRDGAQKYLQLCAQGIALQKSLALQVLAHPQRQLHALGSLYLAASQDVDAMKEEFKLLQELGCTDIELWDKSRIEQSQGMDSGFEIGIFFPHDAVINSAEYARGLLKKVIEGSTEKGTVRVFERCSPVVSVSNHAGPDGDVALTTLVDGSTISSSFVVVATGGMFTEAGLAGIMFPCWSYLVSLRLPTSEVPETKSNSVSANSTASIFKSTNSMNCYTIDGSFDWCITNGYLRLSGEDGYSALKPPRAEERFNRMLEWVKKRYPDLKFDKEHFSTSYGVLSMTADYAPIVGRPSPSNRICYLLGCNASGQASLSYASSLIPGILGYKTLNAEQSNLLRLVDIKRFALLPVVRGVNSKL